MTRIDAGGDAASDGRVTVGDGVSDLTRGVTRSDVGSDVGVMRGVTRDDGVTWSDRVPYVV